jgi:hypothetical protein
MHEGKKIGDRRQAAGDRGQASCDPSVRNMVIQEVNLGALADDSRLMPVACRLPPMLNPDAANTPAKLW